MPADTHSVANQLRALYRDAPSEVDRTVSALFAEKVELLHNPPGPLDGPFDRTLLTKIRDAEEAAVHAVLPDLVPHDVDIMVADDTITVSCRMIGHKADGTVVNLPTASRYTVADGQIVGLQSLVEPAVGEQWRDILAEGGMTMEAIGMMLVEGGFELPGGLQLP